ncbi:uncharacterized protein LOC127252904 [Andrographis paniculata]|uniref:uncharacterized protein LOC127252904 n=1 Tax=Andrographis paniculata TaxID=175694 RepID=UPI0021E91403|nr:uncharacterized protein LOC127252904 [Andrographis paniculata]XP_051133247.1 uncharacterized protein LOC127252904 [Andrographis paniculata]XP_051133248.1 uncharacterized protein LOC127252904 [Andrographis paniculata]
MACEAVQTWSLIGIAAAFLDLAIAYSLLCASALAFFASKFLSFFGMSFPCLCDGVFANIWSRSFCLNSLLFKFPSEIVSHVFISVKENFPFQDSITRKCNHSTLGELCVTEVLEVDGEASCSSLSDARKPVQGIRIRELSARTEKYDLKGKGVVGHRPRSRLRQRRKWGGGIGTCYPPVYEVAGAGEPYSHSTENGLVGGISLMGDNDNFEGDDKASSTLGLTKAIADIFTNPKTPSSDQLQNDQQEVQTLSGGEKNVIRLLEGRLEEERIARAALYVELEKERNAAATAADEAMAMILRLQEEKAAIEMEARQYQRILEEKSVYDAEEMTILKEILIRREKENHFLEKEVEAYKHMVSAGGEQNTRDFEACDDQALIPRQFIGFTEKSIAVEKRLSDSNVSIEKPTTKLSSVNESSLFKKQRDSDEQSFWMSVCNGSGNMDLQEKQIISVGNNLPLSVKAASFGGKELDQNQDFDAGHKLAEKVIVSCHRTEADNGLGCTSSMQEAEEGTGFNNSSDSTLDKDFWVHDVHIDGVNLNADASNLLLVEDFSGVNERNSATVEEAGATGIESIDVVDFPSSSGVRKTNSEITCAVPLVGPKDPSLPLEMRQGYAAPVEREMVKIKSEVGWLHERLKLVQEGRDKLSLSGENKERESLELMLLEDIAHQVEEIRHITETGKAARQVSLPLLSAKAASKKRRSRSVSSGFQISSEDTP